MRPAVAGASARLILDAPLARLAASIEERLPALLPVAEDPPQAVHRAMRYAVGGAGKRLRSVFSLAVGEMLGAAPQPSLDLACAVEMVHACSLVLDDLPAMDDAKMRRGRPTVHRAFGEGVALLAAYCLLNRAFALLAEGARALRLTRYGAADLVACLAGAVGSEGLIAGQALDLGNRGAILGTDALGSLHRHKTGSLFAAAGELAALAADAEPADVGRIRRFALELGLAFQILDDLLDLLASPEEIGKDVGQDVAGASFARRLGTEAARDLAGRALDRADLEVTPFGRRADALLTLAGAVRQEVCRERLA